MKKIVSICVLTSFVSCKTYELTPLSLKNQLENSSLEKKDIHLNNASIFFNSNYMAVSLDSLEVFDKKGNRYYLQNSPSIEMRLINFEGEKFTMYFDTVVIKNDTLIGSRSRFMSGFKYKVPFNTISKVFVQDGHKDFKN
ncbi:hypothetical protein SAMN02927937_01347 [Paenimyroides aquimaris]|uniref:Uncharacterized protein n=1 Tax=Paenimyroides marinum TaxID=1159016 RepID=A0A1H6KUB1_9FLAO|nr:hypothetical protein [Paenimyroides aquimaris]SEH77159.1 hypothetical protein SAMN02927937_01347 [Paenimyroides aquimaris]